MEISGSEIHKLTRNMIQVRSQVVQVKLMGVLPGIHGPPMVLTFKVGLPLSAAKIPRMMTTKTKTTPSKICAKHLNYYYNIFNISNRGFEIIIDIDWFQTLFLWIQKVWIMSFRLYHQIRNKKMTQKAKK